jgi:hypothetical protein
MVSSNNGESGSATATAHEHRLVFPSKALAEAREFAARHASGRPTNHRDSLHAAALRGPRPLDTHETGAMSTGELIGSIGATLSSMQRSLDRLQADADADADADAQPEADSRTLSFTQASRGVRFTLRPDPSTPPPRSAA